MTPPDGCGEMRRIVVPNWGSVTAWPTAGLASAVIGVRRLVRHQARAQVLGGGGALGSYGNRQEKEGREG